MLTEARKQMDDINKQLIDILIKRFEISQTIGDIKCEKGIPIYDIDREAEIMRNILAMTPEEYRDAISNIFSTILSESRNQQLRNE